MASSGPSGPVVRRALLSVSDDSGLLEFARGLSALGVELLATSGTGGRLAEAGVATRAAEELTGIGAWFGGRIKTLHPGLLGGILAERSPEGLQELSQRGLVPIDLVAVTLYPFESHTDRPGGPSAEELIDVGGVTLLRSAGKNHRWVAALSDPSDYPTVLDELRRSSGALSEATRRQLAAKAFDRTSRYDRLIASRLAGAASTPTAFPEALRYVAEPIALRYGENPHQSARVYRPAPGSGSGSTPPELELVKGESLSYTNLLDLETALGIVGEFPTPTAAVVKHATPCGVASGADLREAIRRAVDTDPVARYGCVIALNRPFAAADAQAFQGVFVDLLAAPAFEAGALERLASRPKLKAVRVAPPTPTEPRWEARSALGRLLVQEVDRRELAPGDLRLVTSRAATPRESCSLDFAWRVVRHARSNAIVLSKESATVGIGSGQPTRVMAVELAVGVAGDRAKGAVLASDAFFPFADGIEAAGRAGVTAILQPGGSLRDPEVIATAERLGIAMYLTGWRVFRH